MLLQNTVLYSLFAPPVSFKRLVRDEKRNSKEHPSQGRQNSKSERKTKELILPDLSENLFCTVVLTSPSFAYFPCKWHGNTCNWGLWRLDDCEDEMFLSAILGQKCAPQLFDITFALSNIWLYGPNIYSCLQKYKHSILKIKSLEPCTQRCGYIYTNSHGCKMQCTRWCLEFSLKWCPSIYHKVSSIAIRILLYITSQFA